MKTLETLVSRLTVGQPQHAPGLAVFPLFLDAPAPMDYLLLDDAIEQDLAHVTEVSHEGSVPDLAFENGSPRRVLLVDGDELVGARQNRIVNISILVGGGKKLVIPVSCVEQGRWSYRSSRFAAAKRSLFASARAKKFAAVTRSMKERGSRRADQGEIWGDIGRSLQSRGIDSGTSAMSDLFEAAAPRLDEYERSFTVEPRQSGAVFANGTRVIGLELFDAPEAFARSFGKMVRAYAMDAYDVPDPFFVDMEAVKADVRRFVDAMVKATEERFEALGEGADLRLEGEGIAGGALVDGERVVHLAAFSVI